MQIFLYVSLSGQLCISRDEVERYEVAKKEMLPYVVYKAAITYKRIRKKVPDDVESPEIYLNATNKFRYSAFYTVVDKLESEMKGRGSIHKEITE